MKVKSALLLCISFIVIILGVGIGSVSIPPLTVIKILVSKILPVNLMTEDMQTLEVIILRVRLPRVLTAFVCGGALAMTGSIMQSCMKNLLASTYTIGVSSGASLAAALSIFFGTSLSMMSLPLAGSIGAVLTIFAVVKFSQAVDRSLSNNTIILVGMTFSLFINAMLTVLVSLNHEKMGHLLFWQMGNFGWHGWSGLAIMFPCLVLAFLFLLHYASEADILTFGDEQALSLGVQVERVKKKLLVVSSLLTGVVVAFVGIIGFVDLIAPHVVRKYFGAQHTILIPMSFLFGASLMVLCDMVARTILSPRELSVGAVTAIIGAPFFAYMYFSKRESHA